MSANSWKETAETIRMYKKVEKLERWIYDMKKEQVGTQERQKTSILFHLITAGTICKTLGYTTN